jgi:TonB family protein
MKTFRVSLLTSLTLAMGAQVWAQSPSVAPAPEAPQSQASASLSKRERIELCRKKRGVPLSPEEPQPQPVGGGITRPTPIYQVPPHSYFRGKVAVETVVDEDGCVRQTRVVRSIGQPFDDAAAKAFSQWVFLPATQAGRPVRVYYVLTVSME